MKNIILCILIILSSCSFVPESPLDLLSSQNTSMSLANMERRYPYFNTKVSSFRVMDEDPGFYHTTPPLTPERAKESRRISIRGKEAMLNKLSAIRFVINTPEFAELLKTRQFYSSYTKEGPYGSIKKGDPMDSERLLYVLQKVNYQVRINRRAVPQNAAASANVGTFLYLADDQELANVTFKELFVNYPNRENWEGYSNTPYYLGILFHELVHNMGFNHHLAGTGLADATVGLQNVMADVFRDPKWQKKYKKQLESYQYYTKKYEHLLQEDTVVIPAKKFDDTDLFSIDQIQTEEVCILYPDGTHKLVKVRNGRMI